MDHRLDPTRLEPLLVDAGRRAAAYLAGLDDRPVAASPEAVAAMHRFLETPLAEAPRDPAEVLADLDRVGSPATHATAGGRWFGMVVGGTVPAAVATSALIGAWDQNAGMENVSPAGAAFEAAALRDLLALLGLPADCAGGFCTGATLANFTALMAARRALLLRRGWDPDEQGLFGAPPLPVATSADIHPSVRKALGMLGLGRTRVRELAVDDQGRIRPEALGRLPEGALVLCQAGNVNTAACDPFHALADAVAEAGGWLHVDGAFGLWAAASPALRHLVDGVERADSWATDAHKWLNAPYDGGLAFVRDGESLRASCAAPAAYLPEGARREPCHTTPELSRRARGVEAWVTLRALGRRGVAELVERCCRHARRFGEGLAKAGHRVLNDVVLNQVVVTFGSDAATARTIEKIQRDGTCWCGPSHWQGGAAMRISVSSWATTDEDVERSLEAILRCAAEARRELASGRGAA